ncbi:hypothetical protein [Isoptericola sp. NPDC056605]|uniref:hypothetical protein n=1 Tax=Isoptericola sp. NPDC056605 TaxID=3345876 RepID=UPI0036950082
MSGLDETTLLVVTPVVLLVVSTLYVVGVVRRTRTDVVDRCWTLTFLAAIVTTFAYLAGGASSATWWATGLGNGAFVLSLGAIWAGARARAGRRSLLWVVATSAVVVALAALVDGPDGGAWAGGIAYLLGVAAWSMLAAVELLGRAGPAARRAPEAAALGFTCAVASAFYAARAVVFAAGSPTSPTFERWFPTTTTTLVNLVLVLVGAFAMMALRTRETTVAAAVRFDPVLGTRTLAHLGRTVTDPGGRPAVTPVRVVVLRCRDGAAVRDAFGPEGREQAWAHLADVVLRLLPAGGAAGSDRAARDEVLVVLPDGVDDAGWVSDVRRELLDRPVELDGDTIVLEVAEGRAAGGADALAELVRTARADLVARS